jgi:hypothetical protein
VAAWGSDVPRPGGPAVLDMEGIVADACRSAEQAGKESSSTRRAASATGVGAGDGTKRTVGRGATRTCSLSRGQGCGDGINDGRDADDGWREEGAHVGE